MITLESLKTEKRTEILRLAELHGAKNVRVFGSVARGDNTEESDVDFLVEMEPDRSLFDLIRFKHGLEDLLGKTVDVVTDRSLHYIRERVLSEARPL
jgi:uncharacterized protein